MADDDALISVVAPVFNEIETLPEFHRRVTAALEGRRYELVLVNDGSSDGTGRLLQELAAQDPAVRPVHLSRNFGHQAAVTAGLEAAQGAAAVTIDADLQDPPEVIPRLSSSGRRAPMSCTAFATSAVASRAAGCSSFARTTACSTACPASTTSPATRATSG